MNATSVSRQSSFESGHVANLQVAQALEEVADLLESQDANTFRVGAYRKAAATISTLPQDLWMLYHSQGLDGLTDLPGIGQALGRSIEQLLCEGRLPLLERLRGEDAPQRAFATVPDIGPKLAARIHEHLGIETLADLEAAAHDGRLAAVPGMGEKRLRAVRESLAGRFRRRRSAPPRTREDVTVPVEELLDVDAEYRRLAAAGKLRKIAPRRFNPTAAAWLPVLHTQRGDRHYTALFSNTARAHELGTTHDWVVIYRDDKQDGQWTVITARLGKLRGQRVVRGREDECADFYRHSAEHQHFRQRRLPWTG